MMRSSRPSQSVSSAVFIFLSLWLFFTQAVYSRSTLQEVPQKILASDFRPTSAQKAEYQSSGGHERVHREWSRLREHEPTWIDTIANTAPSTFIGKAWHFTKVVLRTLFMNGPTSKNTENPSITPELNAAIDAWEFGALYEDADAIFLLAQTNFFGNFSHPRNFKEAFKRYEQLANLDGNATAQHMLGLMYSTGVGNGVKRDQAKALLYHTFAAEQGFVKSEMTLAFRYHTGIATTRDCDRAADYYKSVADKAMAWWQSGPPGGHVLQRNNVRWIEFEGGSYGEGASMSSSGPNAPNQGSMTASMEDVLEILDMRERQGDWNAVLTLGKHYYEPPRGYRRNLRKAQKQFNKIAKAYWKDGKVNPKAPKGIESSAGRAAAYIGRMFLRGEGWEQNFEKAAVWFRRALVNGDALAQYHLGLMYRDGLGVPKDGSKAATFLKAASEQSLASAHSALAVFFLDQGDVDVAYRYLELAAAGGVMEAYYYLAEIYGKGIGAERNCALSVNYYKVVAEKAEMLHSSFQEANAAYEKGHLDRAFIAALMAAEQGYENAQANVALLLDQKTSVLTLPYIPLLSNPLSPVLYHGKKRSKLLTNPGLALVYYTRSAKQLNTDSLIKMGDYHLAGGGHEFIPAHKSPQSADPKQISSDLEKASSCYVKAADSHHSAQALWNLGWMYEHGVGPMNQDFHLAKRYYDLALSMNKEAYLPVKLALIKLRMRSWWNGITGGKINGIKKEESATKRPKTFMEWVNRFLDAAEEMDAQDYADSLRQAGANGDDMDIDGVGGYGEAGMPGGDGDYYYRGQQQDNIEGDYIDGDFDDGIIESLIIIALAGALAMLVYARQQRQRDGTREERERREREERERNGAQHPRGQGAGPGQNGGFFPNPGDPDFANWVAGGIGH